MFAHHVGQMNRFRFHDLDLTGGDIRLICMIWCTVLLILIAQHVTACEPYNLHDLGHFFLGWISTTVQILYNIS